jgi:hypothetical protein
MKVQELLNEMADSESLDVFYDKIINWVKNSADKNKAILKAVKVLISKGSMTNIGDKKKHVKNVQAKFIQKLVQDGLIDVARAETLKNSKYFDNAIVNADNNAKKNLEFKEPIASVRKDKEKNYRGQSNHPVKNQTVVNLGTPTLRYQKAVKLALGI